MSGLKATLYGVNEGDTQRLHYKEINMIIDNDMEFNETRKRWYLTENYVYNELGTDLSLLLIDEFDTNVSTLNRRKIKYACDMLYDYIDLNAFDKTSTYWAFCEDETIHNALKDALGYQLFYFAQNGDISNDVGNKVRNTVSERAIQVLNGANAFHIVASVPKEFVC